MLQKSKKRKGFGVLTALCGLPILLLIAGCGKNQGENEARDIPFAATVARGKVHSTDFTVVSGRAMITSNNDAYLVTLFNQAIDNPCGSDVPTDTFVEFEVAKSAGVSSLSPKKPVSFIHSENGQKFIGKAYVGKVDLSKVSAGFLKGRVQAEFDAGSDINGLFEVPVCP